MTRGAASRTARTRRPGTSVRSTTHAATTPIVAQAGTARSEQRDRVHKQLEDTRAERQLDERREARLHAEDDDVGERDQRDGGDGDRRNEQRGRKVRRWRASRPDHAGTHVPIVARRLTDIRPPRSEDASLGHQVRGDRAVERRGIDHRRLQVDERNEGRIGRHVARDRVLERVAGLEDRLAVDAGDELQERLCRSRVLARLEDAATRDADEGARVLVLEVVQLDVLAVLSWCWPGRRTSSSGR